MKKLIFLASILLMAGDVSAQEYEIEESEDANPGICIPEEECEEQACNRRRCRRLRRRRCCASRDEDAYWPGKMENSFMEEMMR